MASGSMMHTAIMVALSNDRLCDTVKRNNMKTTIISSIIVLAVSLLEPQISQAQGTLYISSLSANSTGSASVGSNSWLAAGFGTGNNAGGYVLNSIQLGMMNASGNPSGFTVLICASAADPVNVGSSLGTLTGSANPATAGTYTYNAGSEISLSPSTAYYIVITAETAVANGAYSLSESAYPPTSSGDWGSDHAVLESVNGLPGWGAIPYEGIAQFAIYATPVPEPGVIGLLGLGGLLVGVRHWKARVLK